MAGPAVVAALSIVAATSDRASALAALGTESSRSRMTASTAAVMALVMTRALMPGANRATRTGFMQMISSKAKRMFPREVAALWRPLRQPTPERTDIDLSLIHISEPTR